MSKPPDPSPSSRALALTITSSPSSTRPVSRGYAMHGTPSTSQRTSSGSSSTIAVTRPRLSDSCIEERHGNVDHGAEVVDGDVLVGRVDLCHAVGEHDARNAALVEDVRVGS